MTTLGGITLEPFLKHESHKMHVEFEATATIKKGQACKLFTDGTVRGIAAGDAGTIPVIGYAINDAISGQFVTLICTGYVMVNAASGAAIIPGLAKTAGVHVDSASGTTLNTIIQAADIATAQGWCLDTAGAANGLVRFIVWK